MNQKQLVWLSYIYRMWTCFISTIKSLFCWIFGLICIFCCHACFENSKGRKYIIVMTSYFAFYWSFHHFCLIIINDDNIFDSGHCSIIMISNADATKSIIYSHWLEQHWVTPSSSRLGDNCSSLNMLDSLHWLIIDQWIIYNGYSRYYMYVLNCDYKLNTWIWWCSVAVFSVWCGLMYACAQTGELTGLTCRPLPDPNAEWGITAGLSWDCPQFICSQAGPPFFCLFFDIFYYI